MIKRLINNFFRIEEVDNHKIVFFCGIKVKFRVNKNGYNINGQNNKIIVVENGKERELKKDERIQGLEIIINGNYNIIKLHAPLKFIDCFWDIKSDNGYVEIESPKYSISLYLCMAHKNEKLIIKKPIFISSMKCFLAEDYSSVYIDEGVMISMEVILMPNDAHPIFYLKTGKRINYIKNEVYIGKHCWIGMRASILKNVKTPNNTIIGFGSVITKSFEEEYTAIAGNPAKIVTRNVNWDESLEKKNEYNNLV